MAQTVPAPSGWNTWDVQYHTGWVHLPTGLRVRFALRSPSGEVTEAFTWRRGLGRLGHHTVDGRYAAVSVGAEDTELSLRVRGGDDSLDVLAVRESGHHDVVLVIDEATGTDGPAVNVVSDGSAGGMASGGPAVSVVQRANHSFVVHRGGESWSLRCTPAPVVAPDDPRRLAFPASDPDTREVIAISLRPTAGGGAGPLDAADDAADDGADADAEAVAARVERAGAQADAARLRTSGWLGSAGDAMTRALTWNTVYAPDLGRVLTPTSRDFVCRERDGFYGRWALHTWDTFFTGLVAGWVDPAYAEGIFGQILSQAGPDGMLPNRISDDKGRTDDRSQPPIGGYTVLKAYLGSGLSVETRRRELLSGAYPVLRDWHAWWAAARRGRDGLLAWGSDPVEGDPESATIDRAKRESGLDDSPMYDDAVLDPATHTMDLADVGLNALYLADAEALAQIADILGEPSAAAAVRRDTVHLRQRSGELLWDARRHRYGNRWSTGDFSEHTSPTLLYPLLAGLPDPDRASALADALLEPGVLGGDPPLPSTARDDPGFSTRYWRGRIWAPMAFLAVEGLRRYDLTGHSRPVVDALLRLFLREWTEHSHVRENYPIVPGEDVRALGARSDGLMGWGGLLAYLAIQELADPRPDGWRFAHPGRDASVERLALVEGRLGVRAAERLVVSLDGAPLLDLPPEAVVTGFDRTRTAVRGVVTVAAAADVAAGRGPLVGVPPATAPGAPVEVRVADAVWSARADDRGLVHLDGWARPDARGRSVAAFCVQSR
jgi:hypothetical protein